MRRRLERKLQKQLRLSRYQWPNLVSALQHAAERNGLSLGAAVGHAVEDTSVGWANRSAAARVLAWVDDQQAVSILLRQFFRQEETGELWETALALEHLEDPAAVAPLGRALTDDKNADRRRASARALGWIPSAGPRAANALVRALLDHSQPSVVREEAAHSLCYSSYTRSIPALVSVVNEPNVWIRFWSVCALGTRRPSYEHYQPNQLVIDVLERKLSDEEIAPTWWSVGREALASLGRLDRRYRATMEAEAERIKNDPEASPADRRWAEWHG